MSSTRTALPAIMALLLLPFAPAHAIAAPCSVSSFAALDLPRSIPDPGSAESVIDVPAGDPIAAISVRLTISHPFDSDLKLELVSPGAKSVVLAEAVGMWGQDFTNTVFDDSATSSIVSALPPFTGRFRSVEPMTAFTGSQRLGRWTLRVSDLRGGYAGRLESWSMELTTCGSATPPPTTPGAPEPPPLPAGVPTGHVAVVGTLIMVTTTSDAVNGEVSSVAALQANPGPDGISLREAILATNNNAGSYTVRFAPSLAGSTIQLTGELPALLGGGLLIDGDIDGDGRPDVTIDGQQITLGGRCGVCGFAVVSSGNRLHALRLRHFSNGVFFAAESPHTATPAWRPNQTFAGNVISGVVMTEIAGGQARPIGIWIAPSPGRPPCGTGACQTNDRWVDTRFVGNTIDSSAGGIEAHLELVIGDVLQRITLAGNQIRIGAPGSTTPKFGINLAAGGGAGANDNRISDALIAYNSVEVGGHGYAINVFSGFNGGSRNVVEDLRVLANQVRFSGVPAVRAAARGFSFAISDGCGGGPGIDCSKNNVVRRAQIVGNRFEGQDNAGVMASEACCGGVDGGTLTELRIANNVIKGIISPHELNPWGIVIGAAAIDVSGVTIESNTITQEMTEPQTYHVAYLAGAGIAVASGIGAGGRGSIRDVSVTTNRIDTDLVGIAVIGGGLSDDDAANESTGHSVSGVQLRGNLIGRAPTLATRWDPNAKAINVIGGLGGTPPASGHWRETKGNSVSSITLANNLVAGLLDDVSVTSNFGAGASGNAAPFSLSNDVEQRIAEFWRRVDSLQAFDYLTAANLGEWALNVIKRNPGAGISVADFRASTAGMQAALDRAAVGVSPGAPGSPDVEQRIARFWQRVDALGPGDLLTATDLGQWALNVTDRDPAARIRVDEFRARTAGMQAAFDRAAP